MDSLKLRVLRRVAAAKEEGVGNLEYTWSEKDERFDCVVGIAVEDKPIGVGVFIDTETIITSAHVAEAAGGDLTKVKVYTIYLDHDRTLYRKVGCINSPFGKKKDRKGSKYWVKHGTDHLHSPIHDLYTMSLVPLGVDNIKDGFVIATYNKGYYPEDMRPGRRPFMVRIDLSRNMNVGNNYMFAGFGFVDEEHVKDNTFLELEYYEDNAPVTVDCREWLPKAWGYFICIENLQNTPGVPSGAPLFNNGFLVGIGSFTVTKNNESIHVFTDIQKYASLVVCYNLGWTHQMLKYTKLFEISGKFVKRLEYRLSRGKGRTMEESSIEK